MKLNPLRRSILSLSLTLASAAICRAGSDAKAVVQEPEVVSSYQASRGLITLEGPSGMFINPTSATLPRGKFTLQYCLFFRNMDTDVVGHGLLLSAGVTDWLELGFVGNLIDANANVDKEFVIGGPMVRARLLRDQEWWPEISVGGYLKWGTNARDAGTVFVAVSKRIPISPNGFLKSIVLQGGFRETWYDQNPVGDSGRAYAGLEVQLPYRFYVIGEITQKDNDLDRRTPYAYGIQCRLPGVALTLAALQDGGAHERVGIYTGFGVNLGF